MHWLINTTSIAWTATSRTLERLRFATDHPVPLSQHADEDLLGLLPAASGHPVFPWLDSSITLPICHLYYAPISKAEREQFATKYQELHRLVRQSDGTTVLYIGAENWPFPVPLTSENGKWRFDAGAGMEEIFFRQIGENEAVAIQVCHALARAVAGDSGDSNASANVYAQTLVNAHAYGRHGSANAQAVPFRGHYFRQVSKDTSISEGAVVFVAYPARYRSSGVMTFVVISDDVVFQKDLGPNTARLANAIGKLRRI